MNFQPGQHSRKISSAPTFSTRLALGLVVALSAGSAFGEDSPDGPPEPAGEAAKPAPAPRTAATTTPAPQKSPVAVKTLGKKMTMTLLPPKAPLPSPPAAAAPPKPSPPVATVKVPQLKLAPSAAEIENERKREIPPPPKERDPRDATPKQDQRFPTHVDHTRGPGSPLGAGTNADRKGMMQEVSGPSQGVIRNRW